MAGTCLPISVWSAARSAPGKGRRDDEATCRLGSTLLCSGGAGSQGGVEARAAVEARRVSMYGPLHRYAGATLSLSTVSPLSTPRQPHPQKAKTLAKTAGGCKVQLATAQVPASMPTVSSSAADASDRPSDRARTASVLAQNFPDAPAMPSVPKLSLGQTVSTTSKLCLVQPAEACSSQASSAAPQSAQVQFEDGCSAASQSFPVRRKSRGGSQPDAAKVRRSGLRTLD